MHNKVLIVDGRIGVTGGRNYEDKYFDYDPSFNFKDRDVLVVGDQVRKMQDSFEQFWEHTWAVDPIVLVDVQKVLSSSKPA